MHVLNYARSSGTHALHKNVTARCLSVGGEMGDNYCGELLGQIILSVCPGLGLSNAACEVGLLGWLISLSLLDFLETDAIVFLS